MKIQFPRHVLKESGFYLFLCIVLLIILRLPNLFEPFWNNIEGQYSSTALMMHNGYRLYLDIDAGFPGIYAIYYIAQFFGNYSYIIVKLLAIFSSVLSVIFIYKISDVIFRSKISLSTALFSAIIFGVPFFGTNIADEVIFSLPLIILGTYYVLQKKYIFSGLLLGTAFLFTFSVWVYIVFFSLILIIRLDKFKNIKNIIFFIPSFFIPITILLLIFQFSGMFSAFTNNLEIDYLKYSYQGLGFVILPNTIMVRLAIFVILIFLIAIYQRNRAGLNSNKFFFLSWTVISIFSVLLYSGNSINRLIELVPVLSIILAYLLYKIKIKNIIITFLSTYMVLNLYMDGKRIDFNHNPAYFSNFISFVIKKNDINNYIKYFGEEDYRVYRLSSYLLQIKKDNENIYFWTNKTWLYYLTECDKPIEKQLNSSKAYENFGRVKNSIISKKPEIIVIDKQNQGANQLEEFIVSDGYLFEKSMEGFEIYSNKNN